MPDRDTLFPFRIYYGRAGGRVPFIGVAWRRDRVWSSRMLLSFKPLRIYPWTHR